MIGKVVVSGISLILVVGVVVAVVNRIGGTHSSDDISPQMKAVTQICQPTNYKETCTKVLSSANTTDPKELIRTGILAISDSLTKSMNLSEDLVVNAGSEPRTKLALKDCKTLLKNASDELHDTLAKMSSSDLNSIAEHADDFRIWLSFLISYQELCVDGFQHDNNIKSTVQNSTDYGSELTDNVLTILGAISNILQDFGLQFNLPPSILVGFSGLMGIYNEAVVVPKTHSNILMYGDGPEKTIVTGKKSFTSGVNTWNTASFVVEAPGFTCKNMRFENTAGPDGHQAVAIRVNSDMSVFHNCRFDGYQDTLLYQAGRQFYRDCVISGTVDFLFGYGAAVIQNSTIIARKPNHGQVNTVTADGKREKGQNTGLVIHNCKIVPEADLVPERLTVKTYLGRPWKQFSTTVVMESELGDLIQPQGWLPWAGNQYLDTLYYAEYANTGPGANTANRIKWKTLHFLTSNEAQQFTVGTFLPGADQWIRSTGVPFLLGFR
ncbi:hypothetical protein GH714_027130 [Hevea brasiliensis]|uniref:pectinesterase n=1 Tax=Hevea brasiliensis TaxID=3981 RepID=A0A6A6L4D4_HEVBR|nr:hypothetical protein GH714_027130 [Hevea brasiliensis]